MSDAGWPLWKRTAIRGDAGAAGDAGAGDEHDLLPAADQLGQVDQRGVGLLEHHQVGIGRGIAWRRLQKRCGRPGALRAAPAARGHLAGSAGCGLRERVGGFREHPGVRKRAALLDSPPPGVRRPASPPGRPELAKDCSLRARLSNACLSEHKVWLFSSILGLDLYKCIQLRSASFLGKLGGANTAFATKSA